jgi:MYXO-CTERM domain-containing protein
LRDELVEEETMRRGHGILGVHTVIASLLAAGAAWATDYHVAQTGADTGAGSSAQPWKTIQKAASTMQPGDTCTVHAGTYREWVNPARGGTSESARIVYQAAQGEQVYVKGSEQVTTWTQSGGNVWKAVVPNTTFGSFNPYSSTISGSYMTYGTSYHQGDVYLNGEPYLEVLSQGEVTSTAKTWFSQVDATNTTIYANFGGSDPNAGLAEINVRKYVFAPSASGLAYITLDGFNVMHGATNWAPPDAANQEGMVKTNWGMKWIIQNNVVTDSKNVCIVSGTGGGNQAIDKVGNHVIRHNTIQRCGEAGIAGSHGLPASVIDGNLIEEINPTRHFGGYETAAIKIHSAIDVVITGNVIRRVHRAHNGASNAGIWLDWQAQGSRITANVIYDIEDTAIELEADHGPNLIDNNVLVGNDQANTLWDVAESTTYVHNLFANFSWSGNGDGRTPSYFTPHTTQAMGSQTISQKENRYYNNIHVKKGTQGIGQSSGYLADYSVYYNGATKTNWGDTHSIVNAAFDAAFTVTDRANGVDVTWKADTAPKDVACPLITRAFIGVAALTGQGIENHDGTPITIDHDMTGAARSATHPTAGPLEASSATNKITLLVGAPGAGSTGTGGSAGTGGSTGTGGSAGSGGATAAGGSTGAGATLATGGTTGAGGAVATGGKSGSGGTVRTDAGATGTKGGSLGAGGAANSGTGGDQAGEPAVDEAAPSESGGCGCRTSDGSGSLRALWLAAFALVAVRVRRRR